LDVWRDFRGGTHGVGSRLGRSASVLRFFCSGAVLARIVAYGQTPFRLTDDIGQMTVTKGYATMRAHTAPRQKQRKALAPRPKCGPTPCVPPLKSRQTSNERAIARSSRGDGAFSSLLADRKCVPVQMAGDQSAWRRARLKFPKIGAVFLGGEINYRKWCIRVSGFGFRV